jgi:hypothetical protein
MEPRRRNPLRRYPTAVCISVWHFGLTQSKTRALNSPGSPRMETLPLPNRPESYVRRGIGHRFATEPDYSLKYRSAE